MYNHQEYIDKNKPKSKEIKAGDWIVLSEPEYDKNILRVEKINNKIITCLTNLGITNFGPESSFKLWKPNIGELCVFTDKIGSEYVAIGYLKDIDTVKNKYISDTDFELGWRHCLPLEYLIELRRKQDK